MFAYAEYNLAKLKENILKLKKNCNDIIFLFPVKCCNNDDVLNLVAKLGFGFDISNNQELKIIEKYLDGRFISASGPLAKELQSYKYSNLHIAVNNINDYKSNLGIRINFNSDNRFDISHFGVDFTKINKTIKDNLKYIHFHNSDKRTLHKCEIIENNFIQVIQQCPNLKYINIGGHLEDLSFEEGIHYLKRMREIIPKNIILIAELGDFIFKKVGQLHSKVIDTKIENETQIVILNFSKMANQRWAYPIYNIKNKQNKLINTKFYGCSCCETDFFYEGESELLIEGDEIIFDNISPYSYQWNISFNGVPKINNFFKK